MEKEVYEAVAGIMSIFVAAAALNNPLWTDVKGAESVLAKARPDLTVQNVEGYCWFAGHDLYKTRFIASDQKGETVKGCVTRGAVTKGSTIRYDL